MLQSLMIYKGILLTLSIFFSALLFSQDEHFLVELEPFSPDVAMMIQMMEGNPAESFESKDITGNDHNFDDFLGQSMVFWFWSIDDEMSAGLIDGMNLMHDIFSDRVKMLTFTHQNIPDVQRFISARPITFDIVPNSLRISDLLYGSELGIGRVFLIDQKGIVKKALPRQFFIDNDDSFNQLRALIQQLIDEEK